MDLSEMPHSEKVPSVPLRKSEEHVVIKGKNTEKKETVRKQIP